MVRTCLDNAEWASLLLVLAIQGLPRAWKRDEGALRRFVEAALWICRTGPPSRSSPAVKALGRSHGGLGSKLHGCVDGAGRILRLLASPGHHAGLRYALPLLAGIPARDAALDRGSVPATLRAAFTAQSCTVHT